MVHLLLGMGVMLERYLIVNLTESACILIIRTPKQENKRPIAMHAVSRIVRTIIHSCTDFGNYFTNVQSKNCGRCPDCRCGEGPSVQEAQQDYRAMLRSLKVGDTLSRSP